MFETTALAIPLSYLLIPYGIFLLFILIYSAFTFYHLLRFGVGSTQLYLVIAIYVIGLFGALSLSASFLASYDWDNSIGVGSFGQDVPAFPL